MNEDIFSNEDQLESGESRDAEKQELEDATNEPRARVEQSGDYQQAEAIQDALTQLTDGVEPADVPVQPVNPLGEEEDLPLPCPPGDLPEGSGKLAEEGKYYAPNPGKAEGDNSYIPEDGDPGEQQIKPLENNPATLHETIDTSQLEYEPGPVQQPPDWDHGPPKDQVNLEDENTVLGRQPKVREDLDDLKTADSDDDSKLLSTGSR